MNPSTQEAARVKGLEELSCLIGHSIVRENLYRRRYKEKIDFANKEEFAPSHIVYRDALKSLYVKILSFLMTNICFLSKGTVQRNTSDMIKWTKWDELLADVKSQDVAFKSVEEQWRDVKYQEECELQESRHEERLAALNAAKVEISRVYQAILQTQNDHKRVALLEWLSTVDPSANYNTGRDKHEDSTGEWLVKSTEFEDWKLSKSSLLWLHGKGRINLTMIQQ